MGLFESIPDFSFDLLFILYGEMPCKSQILPAVSLCASILLEFCSKLCFLPFFCLCSNPIIVKKLTLPYQFAELNHV